ncbi:hypothetical protein MHU86_25144 [Fragilaria crotonensis]|nr:hypothetical protein MHU86_25144 [Fragilaria crotonensis]
MTEGATDGRLLAEYVLPPDDDIIFGFKTDKWYDPPFELQPTETETNKNIRLAEEHEYRKSHTPTEWHRYAVLARHTVETLWFDEIWNDFTTDPSTLHHLVWYNFMYHVDQKLDIPPQLDAWATTISQPYLAIHAHRSLELDTSVTSWKSFKSTIIPWVKIGPHNRPPKTNTGKSSPSTPPTTAAPVINPYSRSQRSGLKGSSTEIPPTIHEEPDLSEHTSNENPPPPLDLQTPPTGNQSIASSRDGKQSALIPNLGVPVNDGTHRVTLRIKMSTNASSADTQSDEIHDKVYNILTELFLDEDGKLYNWHIDDLRDPNFISNMTLIQIRSHMPRVTIVSSQSLVIVHLRYGFATKNPSVWKNRDTTKAIFARHNITVSISNSKSTSGRLVIAGYLLLKAPNLTHRVRYLQSLRTYLPDDTPPFDLLLYRRTPLDQKIDHLVIQCGEKHVHPVSDALLKNLSGPNVGTYLPRFSFEKMTSEQVTNIFLKHDAYIKSLKLIPLAPFITNIDSLRTEHRPDGTTIERSIRAWASSIAHNNIPVQCDVVNGGYDQRAYLVVSPQNEELVKELFQEYKKMVFPFTKREARFRSTVGPPSIIHVDYNLQANLAVFDNLTTEPHPGPETLAAFNSVTDSQAGTSTISSLGSQVPTTDNKSFPAAIRKKRSDTAGSVRPSKASTSGRDDNGTDTTSHTGTFANSSFASTQNAKFHELDAQIQRQREDIGKLSKLTDKRLEQLERQLHRIDKIEETVTVASQTTQARFSDMDSRFNDLEQKLVRSMEHQLAGGSHMETIEDKLNSLMTAVQQLASSPSASQPEQTPQLMLAAATPMNTAPSNTTPAQPVAEGSGLTGTISHNTQSIIHSPEKKRPRATPPEQQPHPVTHTITEHDTADTESAMEIVDYVEIQTQPTDSPSQQANQHQPSLEDITTDLAARYDNTNALGGGPQP